MVGGRDRLLVYLVTNTITRKQYVGITTQTVSQRWSDHCKANDTYLARAIRKHGKISFIIEHIASAGTIDDLKELEKILIQQHQTLKPNGYNVHPGGDIAKHTPQTIERMRAVQSSRSAEWRANLSKALTGQIISEERRRKLSLVERTPEQRAKIAAALTGRKVSKEITAKQSATIRSWWAARKAAVPDGQGALL